MEFTDFFQTTKIPATVVHVLSVVLGMGGALVSDVLFSFFGQDKKLNNTEIKSLDIISKLVFYSLFVVILSGIFIFLSDTEKYLSSTKFMAKMSILLVLLVNGYILNRYVWPHLLKKNFFVAKNERNTRQLAFACGAISVISWLSVCTLGVLDSLNFSYIFIISIYGLTTVLAVCTALIIERKELN